MDVLNTASGTQTPLGRVNAGTKMVLALLVTAAFLVSLDWVTSVLGLAGLLVLMVLGGLKPWRAVRTLWPIFLAALLSGWGTLLMAEKTGTVLLDVGFFRLTSGALDAGTAIFLRGCALALVSVMFVATTDPSRMGQSLAQTFRLPARFVLSAVAAFRLVGILAAEWQALAAARRARGLGSGHGLRAAAAGLGHQSFALMVQALRRAARLATTMEARGFGAGPRTWAESPSYSWRDAVAVVLGLAVPVLAIGISTALGTYRMIFWAG